MMNIITREQEFYCEILALQAASLFFSSPHRPVSSLDRKWPWEENLSPSQLLIDSRTFLETIGKTRPITTWMPQLPRSSHMRLANTSSSPPSKPFSATVWVSFSRSLFFSHRRLPLLSATGVPSSRNNPYSLGGESHKNGTLSRNLQFWRSKNMEKGWKRSLQPSSGPIPRRTREFKDIIQISCG